LSKKKEQEPTVPVSRSFKEYLDAVSKKTGRSNAQVIEDYVSSKLPIFIMEESIGQTQLKLVNQLTAVLTGEKKPATVKRIKEYRKLADTFAPVSAGIENTMTFTIGGGFESYVEDPENKVMIRNKEEIDRLNASIYQDYYNRGLDRLFLLQFRPTLIDGFGAAEIVYEEEMKFLDYVTGSEEKTDVSGKIIVDFEVDHDAIKWREHKGIQRLKMIDDAVFRLEPIRDNKSFEVKYWILDKGQETQTFLLPQQLFILNWNVDGTHLIGKGMIGSVAVIAILLQEILNAIGINFRRWGNKRYFLIMGTPERPFSPTHIQNLLKDTKEMVTKNKMAVAAPAGFDYKEIGGEIFEGRDIIDTMLGIIAAGMGFPKEFLESPRTSASDKSWLAWLVKNGKNQRQLKRAVEQQLWEKHLWCLYGKETRLSKKGVPVDQQKRVPQYVPKMRWKRATLQSTEERIKMLVSLLNTANPITVGVKLAVEKELAKTLGFDDIKFPTQEELEKALEKQQREQEAEAKKRALGGVSTEISPTGKPQKPQKSVGGTRVSKSQKALEESIDKVTDLTEKLDKIANKPQHVIMEHRMSGKIEGPEPIKVIAETKAGKQEVDVNIKTEPTKIKLETEPLEIKTKPIDIKIKHEKPPVQKVEVEVKQGKPKTQKLDINIKHEKPKTQKVKVKIEHEKPPIQEVKVDVTAKSEPQRLDITLKKEKDEEKEQLEKQALKETIKTKKKQQKVLKEIEKRVTS